MCYWSFVLISTKSASGLRYEPGDALCLACPNNDQEVDYLLERFVSCYKFSLILSPSLILPLFAVFRLGLSPRSSELVELSVIPGTAKRSESNFVLPADQVKPLKQFSGHLDRYLVVL